MIDEREAKSMQLVKLAAAWGIAFPEVRQRVYLDALEDVGAAEVARAVGVCIRESRFFPSVAELRAAISGSVDDRAVLALVALQQAAERVGAWSGVVLDDPAAATALRAIWGDWPTFCAQESDGPAWAIKRQEFFAAYRAAAREKAESALMLRGIAERVESVEIAVRLLGAGGEERGR